MYGYTIMNAIGRGVRKLLSKKDIKEESYLNIKNVIVGIVVMSLIAILTYLVYSKHN